MVWSRARLDRLGDEALLAAVGLDDVDAAAVLVRRFQRRVYGLALTITLDAAAAEDVAQQAFERAWHHAGAYDARRGTVVTWLLTITRNLAIDALRVRRPRPVDPSLVQDLLPPDGADPADAAVRDDCVELARRALASLPEEQQRAVVLATIGSRTSAEIAELEGVPVPTAKYRVQAGLRKLRVRLRTESEL
ncbi:MAG: sigma-70 family RNA polymerase sigma factor [Chloroflexota bacterium]